MTCEIIVAGFPKSGNTWLTRLLSDALDYPVCGIDDAIPLAADQQTRPGDGLIRQLHLIPLYNNEPRFVSSRFHLNLNQYHGEKVIHILRDPRDVAVSVNAYWGIGDLHKTLTEVVYTGAWPLWGTGWPEYIRRWKETSLPYIETRYEWLHADTAAELERLINWMGLKAVKPLSEVIERNEINTKRAYLRGADDQAVLLPHGKGAQLANLRNGRVGDWRAEFDETHIAAAHELFTPQLLELGYESDPEWRLAQVQTC